MRRLEGLAHAVVELVVDDGAPERRLLVRYGLQVCRKMNYWIVYTGKKAQTTRVFQVNQPLFAARKAQLADNPFMLKPDTRWPDIYVDN